MPRFQDPKRAQQPGGKNAEAAPRTERELNLILDQIEKDLKELRAVYELYFRGVEKIEPIPQRDLIKAQIRECQRERVNNTAVRYRIQQLKARMVALENYWQRTNRLRESGKYRPDAVRVARREAERQRHEAQREQRRAADAGDAGAAADPNDALHARATSIPAPTEFGAAPPPSGRPITGAELNAGRSAADTAGGLRGRSPAPRASTDMSRPSAHSAEDLTEDKLRRLYDTYVGARKRCGDKVDLRFEDMAAALRKQVPKLMQETGASSVEFKVVIREGRAVLKALPKGRPNR
ncbi:MAG: hypothetical protein H6729_12705 [Deltaproteobacteria bacterium]|nr:hypothetical protein [Deltaproteobacteria bacterium]